MTEAIIRPLTDLLEAFVAIYRSLLGLEEQKNGALLSGDIVAIEVTTQAEGRLAHKLAALERQRQAAIDRLSPGSPRAMTSLTEIIAAAASPAALRLAELQNELREIISQVATLNRLNESLINQSIRFVNCTVLLLTQAGHGNLTYNAAGGTGIPVVGGAAKMYNRQV